MRTPDELTSAEVLGGPLTESDLDSEPEASTRAGSRGGVTPCQPECASAHSLRLSPPGGWARGRRPAGDRV
jgi:hypothetical protein